MLGKLLKYEFKSTSRLLGIIYLAILVMSVVIGFSCRSLIQQVFETPEMYTAIPSTGRIVSTIIMASIYVILVIALVIITYYFIIERFYKSMLKGEGYLMHTLPVDTWQLVACKTISGFVWSILASVVVILSMLIIIAGGGVWNTFFTQVITELFRVWHYFNVSVGLIVTASVLSTIRLILTFYVSMAIGGSAKKHKLLYSVVTFIIILVIMRIIAAIGNVDMFTQLMNSSFLGGAEAWKLNVYFGKEIVWDAIYSAVFFFLSTFFLKRRLNLE